MNFFRYKTLGVVGLIATQSIWALIEFERGSNREHHISFRFEALNNQLYKCAQLYKTDSKSSFFPCTYLGTTLADKNLKNLHNASKSISTRYHQRPPPPNTS